MSFHDCWREGKQKVWLLFIVNLRKSHKSKSQPLVPSCFYFAGPSAYARFATPQYLVLKAQGRGRLPKLLCSVATHFLLRYLQIGRCPCFRSFQFACVFLFRQVTSGPTLTPGGRTTLPAHLKSTLSPRPKLVLNPPKNRHPPQIHRPKTPPPWSI